MKYNYSTYIPEEQISTWDVNSLNENFVYFSMLANGYQNYYNALYLWDLNGVVLTSTNVDDFKVALAALSYHEGFIYSGIATSIKATTDQIFDLKPQCEIYVLSLPLDSSDAEIYKRSRFLIIDKPTPQGYSPTININTGAMSFTYGDLSLYKTSLRGPTGASHWMYEQPVSAILSANSKFNALQSTRTISIYGRSELVNTVGGFWTPYNLYNVTFVTNDVSREEVTNDLSREEVIVTPLYIKTITTEDPDTMTQQIKIVITIPSSAVAYLREYCLLRVW